MTSRIISALALLCSSFTLAAEPDSLSRIHYFYSIHSGILTGSKGNGSTITASLLQGVRYKSFAVGAGLGYNTYLEWQTLPLFMFASADFARGRHGAFFVQCGAGYSKAWNLPVDAETFASNLEGRHYIHPLIGYRIKKDKLRLYLSAGYMFQRILYEQPSSSWGWGPQNKTAVERDMQRVSVQIGLGFR
jgi:hypothetical protein